MKEEQDADEGDDDDLLDELVFEELDAALDEPGPVVHRHDLDALGKTLLEFGKLGLHALDGLQGVLAEAHDHHAAGHVALAVEVREAPSQLRAEVDVRHLPEQYGAPA